MNRTIIELKNIQHCFPGSEWELNIQEFSVSSGNIIGIIGPNGSGKSTLLRIAAGVLVPLKGKILLEDKELGDLDRKTIAKNVGYLPQELSSQYDYTVEEIVRMGRYPHARGFGSFRQEDYQGVEESLKQTEMEAKRRRHLSQLSGGEKKRAFLGSVLAQKPRVLLLDEPASALDIHRKVQFFRILKELAEKGIGVIVVTHDMNVASLFSDWIIFMHEGRCVKRGYPKEVLNKKTLKSIYGNEVFVGKHPETGMPIIFPRTEAEKKN